MIIKHSPRCTEVAHLYTKMMVSKQVAKWDLSCCVICWPVRIICGSKATSVYHSPRTFWGEIQVTNWDVQKKHLFQIAGYKSFTSGCLPSTISLPTKSRHKKVGSTSREMGTMRFRFCVADKHPYLQFFQTWGKRFHIPSLELT